MCFIAQENLQELEIKILEVCFYCHILFNIFVFIYKIAKVKRVDTGSENSKVDP